MLLKLSGSINMNHRLLTTTQAAEQIGLSKAFLERDRCTNARIPFVKLGHRTVRYRQQDIDAFLAGSIRSSTSDQTVKQAAHA